MKNAIKILALSLVLVMVVATLVSCGIPNGKYVLEDSDGAIYLEIKGKEITRTVAYDDRSMSTTFTYEIDGDKIILTNSDGDTQEFDYERDGKTITIGELKYTKE